MGTINARKVCPEDVFEFPSVRCFPAVAMAKAKKASGSGGKKAKDPNAPKRAMSAFFFWLRENRERLRKPGMGVADVAKAAGVEWAKLADKSKWEKKAAEDKARYERDLAAYKKE